MAAVVRRYLIVAVSVFALLAWALPPPAAGAQTVGAGWAAALGSGPVAADAVLVALAKGTDEAVAADAVGAAGGRGLKPVGSLGYHVVEMPAQARDRVAAALARSPLFDLVEPIPVLTRQRVPNDPLWGHQWGLQRVNAPDAWAVTTGSSGVVVAVLDSGVEPTHPDLQGALVTGYNVLTGTSETADDDPRRHGTAVAGIIAARSDNSIGIAGTCWRCSIMPVKVLGSDGQGFAHHVAEGIEWAADNGAHVINLSLGSDRGSSDLEAAVAYAQSKGAIVVAAAGNEKTTAKNYPAAYEGVVAVAASTESDTRKAYSSYGSWVDVAAPGRVLTTMREGTYGEERGTSMAAPIVAGIAGLALSAYRDAGADAVIAAIQGTAVPVGSWVAHGRVDAYATLLALATADHAPLEGSPTGEAVADSACPGTAPSHPFTDIAGNTHENAIACVTSWGLASSATTTYRPAEMVTRGQMASFIVSFLGLSDFPLPEDPPQAFDDVADGAHALAINQLAELDLVGGFTDGTYRPGAQVTRAQMATFIMRTLIVTQVGMPALDPNAPSPFSDVTGTTGHPLAINTLAELGVVGGHSDGTYRPGASVTRAQMASFLRNGLDRAVADGLLTHPDG